MITGDLVPIQHRHIAGYDHSWKEYDTKKKKPNNKIMVNIEGQSYIYIFVYTQGRATSNSLAVRKKDHGVDLNWVSSINKAACKYEPSQKSTYHSNIIFCE